MLNHPLYGCIEVVCGSMFSGKTEELVRRLKRAQIGKQKFQVFKPKIDNRYSNDHVQSHDASRIPCVTVDSAKEIMNLIDDKTRVVGIDEAQFFDQGIVDVAQKLAYRGIRVIVAGLDMDFRGKPFGPMPHLLSVAETITKLQAVCAVCGSPATRSQRLSMSGESAGQILVGAKDSYEARCRFCHETDESGETRDPLTNVS